MSKITITGNITGTNQHFGDNYYYASAEQFKAINPNYTDTEKELVDLIFAKTQDDNERKDILQSLKNLEENGTEAEPEKTKPLLNFLKDLGKSIMVKVVADGIANASNLSAYIATLLG